MNLLELLTDPPDDAIDRFLEAWHGPAARGLRVPAKDARPEAIRRLEALAEAWPGTFAQNRLADADLAEDRGKRVFYVENQAVYVWATDGVGADPVVWGRFNHETRWLAEREPLSRFLLQVVIFEAIMGAPHGAAASSIALPQLEAGLAPLERLPFGSCRWPIEPAWFYAGTDVLAVVNPTGKTSEGPLDRFDVFIGARTKAALGYLDSVDDIPWDRDPG